MNWFVMAIVARALWAGCNITDHYVAKHFSGKSAFSVSLFQEWMAIPPLVLVILVCGMPDIPGRDALLWLGLGGLLGLCGSLPYFAALRRDEAQNLTALFEMVPVFVMLLAFLLLGETMTPLHLMLGLGCIAFGFLFTWDWEKNHLKTTTLLLMLCSSFLYGCYQLSMRASSLQAEPYDLFILLFIGTIGVSTLVSFFIPGCLRETIQGLKQASPKLLGTTLFTQILNLIANFAIIKAYAGAPAAGLVAALSGAQPVFAFLFAHIVSYTAPGHYNKFVWNRDLQIKLVLLAGMIACAAGLRLT